MHLQQTVNRLWKKGRELPFFTEELPAATWTRKCLLWVCGILTFVAILVITFDPYIHYRKTRIIPVLYTQPYWLIPGVLKHYDYDSVIIGSSTAQNFNLRLFREHMGINPVKATASACYMHTGRRFFETALRENPNLQTVVYGLDLFAFIHDPESDKENLPDFLYSGTHWQDYCYWWNFDMLLSTIRDMRKLWRHGGESLSKDDLMFAQQYERDLKRHGEQRVARSIQARLFRQTEFARHDGSLILRNCRGNIRKNLRPILQHPQIKFFLYLPPSSALNFTDALNDGTLEEFLQVREMIYEEASQYPNVTFFDFQVAPETKSLDNFKDMVHYTPGINDRMTTWMAQGKYRIDSLKALKANNELLKLVAFELRPQFEYLLQLH